MGRLLILACSERKNSDSGLIPAINRYDGPAFRVLRKYLRELSDDGLIVYVLSAKFGLLKSEEPIPDYELRMSSDTAKAQRDQNLLTLRQSLLRNRFSEIAVSVGRSYLPAISGFEEDIPPGTTLRVLSGGLGIRLSRLRDWLRERYP